MGGVGKENWCMIGNHSIPVIVDAYLKGFRKWDAAEALADMVATTEGTRAQMPEYRTNGYIASRRGAEAVSKTLEYAYDDACIARLAKALGQNDVAERYAKRAKNWQNVFDSSTGFFRGKTTAGAWVTPFNPNAIVTDSYTEANAWQSYFVPHDVPGLIQKLGGDEKFVARLDEVFDSKEQIVNFSEDVVGLIGMYAHGNEPCHHYAYLYNYAGQPWKTQARIRQIAARSTTTPPPACAATTTAARCPPGTSSARWASTRPTPAAASISSAARWSTRRRSPSIPRTTRAANSPSSPGTTRPRTCISSPPRSTASRSRAAGSPTTRSWPAARWYCRWDRRRTEAGELPDGPPRHCPSLGVASGVVP